MKLPLLCAGRLHDIIMPGRPPSTLGHTWVAQGCRGQGGLDCREHLTLASSGERGGGSEAFDNCAAGLGASSHMSLGGVASA